MHDSTYVYSGYSISILFAHLHGLHLLSSFHHGSPLYEETNQHYYTILVSRSYFDSLCKYAFRYKPYSTINIILHFIPIHQNFKDLLLPHTFKNSPYHISSTSKIMSSNARFLSLYICSPKYLISIWCNRVSNVISYLLLIILKL